jgi:hypothetical protein
MLLYRQSAAKGIRFFLALRSLAAIAQKISGSNARQFASSLPIAACSPRKKESDIQPSVLPCS